MDEALPPLLSAPGPRLLLPVSASRGVALLPGIPAPTFIFVDGVHGRRLSPGGEDHTASGWAELMSLFKLGLDQALCPQVPGGSEESNQN